MSMNQFVLKFDEIGSSQRLAEPDRRSSPTSQGPIVFVVDDEYFSRRAVRDTLEVAGWAVVDFADCETFLEAYRPRAEACLVLDVHIPGMGGLELLDRVRALEPSLPTIVISGSRGISEAVRSMKAGASDFIEKPIRPETLVNSVRRALQQSRDAISAESLHSTAVDHLAGLTPRQHQIMDSSWRVTPARISPPISASANARSRITELP